MNSSTIFIRTGENVKNRLTQFISTYFGPDLDFRVLFQCRRLSCKDTKVDGYEVDENGVRKSK